VMLLSSVTVNPRYLNSLTLANSLSPTVQNCVEISPLVQTLKLRCQGRHMPTHIKSLIFILYHRSKYIHIRHVHLNFYQNTFMIMV
jgi:hypothetical protein